MVVLLLLANTFSSMGFPQHNNVQLFQGKKLDSEVLAPMQRWLTAYNTVVVCVYYLHVCCCVVSSLA